MTAKLIIPLTPATERYRDDLHRFVSAMIHKLDKNAHKGHWEDLDVIAALNRLNDESKELLDELVCRPNEVGNIVMEAADVANFALIISSIIHRDQNVKSLRSTEN